MDDFKKLGLVDLPEGFDYQEFSKIMSAAMYSFSDAIQPLREDLKALAEEMNELEPLTEKEKARQRSRADLNSKRKPKRFGGYDYGGK